MLSSDRLRWSPPSGRPQAYDTQQRSKKKAEERQQWQAEKLAKEEQRQLEEQKNYKTLFQVRRLRRRVVSTTSTARSRPGRAVG